MPRTNDSLAAVLKALLSTGDVTMHEITVHAPGYRALRGYRLIVNSAVTLDGTHASAVRDACGIAVDDAVPENHPMRCGCRETYGQYLVQGCPLHDPELQGGG